MIDTRTIMYRRKDGELEAKTFPSPDAVPVGEGWEDNPAKCQDAPKARRRKSKASQPAAETQELELNDDGA